MAPIALNLCKFKYALRLSSGSNVHVINEYPASRASFACLSFIFSPSPTVRYSGKIPNICEHKCVFPFIKPGKLYKNPISFLFSKAPKIIPPFCKAVNVDELEWDPFSTLELQLFASFQVL